MPPTAPARALPDELLEEIFLRLPPDEPACLVRASLASKLWLGLLSGCSFRGRYREFHGAPPMLGFVYSWPEFSVLKRAEEEPVPLFVSTTKFGARILEDEDQGRCPEYDALDCHHGRVLLAGRHASPAKLVVWDPMTGRRKELYAPEDYYTDVAAVLCAMSSCDHRACHDGPFRVVVCGLHEEDGYGVASVSLLETGEWSKPPSHLHRLSDPCSLLQVDSDAYFQPLPPVLIQDALYFKLSHYDGGYVQILEYDLGSKCLSLIDMPRLETDMGNATVLAMENGVLGFAHMDGRTLDLWAGQMGSDGVTAWTQLRVIKLKKCLPIQNPKRRLRLIGSVEGTNIIFVSTDCGIYGINLKSLEWKKLWKREKYGALFPYISFFNLPERMSPCDAAH